MTSYEVPAMIEDELPAITEALHDTSVIGNVNKAMSLLVSYTKSMISLHDLPAVVKCMQVADKIYDKGNDLVKHAVENVFVFAFSGMRNYCNKVEWKVIQAKMPITLYSIYVK